MIMMRVLGVALDQAGQHLVLLKPLVDGPGEPRVLPIWIGAQEANSILVAINDERTPRPLTHDLTTTLIDLLGARIARAEITKLDAGTFYAELTLVTGNGPRLVDARPSDAIALAVRAGAEIVVDESVFEDAAIPAALTAGADDDENEADAASAAGPDAPPSAADEAKLEEFKRFLDDVDPEDFQG
ncbi:bifunctional nuclease family protein [Agromyces sp. NPDC060279]|uniref:bifunctional nuclease family protein n=1 Tax=Agromyces sp. NPDC060279 TaxID=3347092 RepID=UPI00364CCDB4